MIKDIEENFGAYMNIKDTQFFMDVNGRESLLFHLGNKDDMKLLYNESMEFQFINGIDKDNSHVAIPLELKNGYKYDTENLHHFRGLINNVIIKGQADGEEDLKLFSSLTLSGELVNKLYPPTTVLSRNPRKGNSRGHSIEFRSHKEYEFQQDFEVNNEKGKLIYSCKLVDYNSLDDTSIISSLPFIRLEFDSPQKIETFIEYYQMLKIFVSFCVGQQNVRFDEITLHREVEAKNLGSYLIKNAVCKVFDDYSDYIKADLEKVLNFKLLSSNISSLMMLFYDKKNRPVIDFLPSSNQEKRWLSYSHIKELCRALEVEFKLGKFKLENSNHLDGIKEKMKKAITDYCSDNNDVEDKLISAAHKTIKNLSEPTAEQIIAMLNSIEVVKISSCDVAEFVKTRHKVTHTNNISLNGNLVRTHLLLSQLFYLLVLRRAGVCETSKLQEYLKILDQMFFDN